MKNKLTATLLALLLGWIWAHKFYLWKWVQGIFYILFMFTFIPLILWLLEACLYAFNSKEWFDLNYNFEYIQKQDYLNKK